MNTARSASLQPTTVEVATDKASPVRGSRNRTGGHVDDRDDFIALRQGMSPGSAMGHIAAASGIRVTRDA
jgi:hypothetical protein